jgi:protein phosphatase 1 regulatory subunit 21
MDTPESPSPSDLSVKYQKLATEYSKMRAQVIVLKKGVTDEQSKSKELRDELKEKDQALRKLEQEIECLNFRNQQLTKRVSILQDDLSQMQAAGNKKSKVKNSPSRINGSDLSASNGVIDQELRHKIEENGQLHMRLQTLESDYESVIEDLRRELQELKCETSSRQKGQEDLIIQQRESVNHLHQEKTRLEQKLASCQDELDKARLITQKFLGKTVTEVSDSVATGNSMVQISGFLRDRISELTNKLDESDAKSCLYNAECNRLKQRLIVAADEKVAAETQFNESVEYIRDLKDELSTSVRNYESQLSTMSEHLANLNEKFMKQQEEIEVLQSLKSNGASNKKRNHK